MSFSDVGTICSILGFLFAIYVYWKSTHKEK